MRVREAGRPGEDRTVSRHLVLVAIGPVQEFIAQARRTRDLWYGSHLLSELGRAAARAFLESQATLVFPALSAGDSELDECQAPLREPVPPARDGVPPLSIANKILAEIDVPPGADPETVVKRVREKVWDCWHRMADRAWERCAQQRVLAADGHLREVWNEQIETFPEFVAAWAPIGDGDGGYRDALAKVEAAVAARKNLREFGPWREQRSGAPKSSLDGARSSVLREFSAVEERPFRIGRGESLDAVGLVKRAGGEAEQFVPIGNVALAAWIERAAVKAPAAMATLRRACEQTGIGRVIRPDILWTTTFPFDAQVFLRSRWEAILEEVGRPGQGRRWGEEHVALVAREVSAPFPYVACLVADGDRMGATLNALGSRDRHREFSATLSAFAREARTIVERDHRGALVYAGGDDVLAFVCLPEALACARALARGFGALARQAVGSAETGAVTPSLSVGIGVGHLLEGMGELVQLGRDAERLAKASWLKPRGEDRNALGIIVDKRSGGRYAWRARWEEWEGDPVNRLSRDAELLGASLSAKKVYEVRSALRHAPDPDRPTVETEPWRQVLADEVERILARTHAGEGISPEDVGLTLDSALGYGYGALYRLVSEWVDRMLVARTFARAGVQPETPATPGPPIVEAAVNV